MPRQRARATTEDGSTSLLSSVFSFVSRELDSFVSNATGRSPREDEEVEEDEDDFDQEEEEEEPQASSSRTRLSSREARRHDEKGGSDKVRRCDREHAYGMEGLGSSAPCTRSQSRRRERAANDGENECRRKTKRIASSPLTTPRPARRHPTASNEFEEELVGPDRSRTPPKPSPRRHRRSRSHFTMPGALYDRTSSLEPSPEPDDGRARHVRFASEVTSSPSPPRKQSKTPRSSRYMEAGPSSGRKAPSSCKRRVQNSSDIDDSSEDEGVPSSPIKRASRPRSNSFVQAAIRQHSAEKNPDISLMLPRSPVVVYSSPTKGKEKEKAPAPPQVINIEDSDEESGSDEDQNHPTEADLSVRTRMKGKERELNSARQREKDWGDDEERRRDKERIRVLEEELRKLREELARRSVVPQPNFVPPPPPPPPPPRPPVSSVPQASQPSSTFADVRASLRHAGTPVEKPINPAAYGGPSMRKGQPTVNVGADMMAAFLNELRTHRLRKVGASDEGPSTMQAPRLQPAARVREVGDVGNRSEVMFRPREVEDIGNKSEVLPRPNRSSAASDPKTNGKINPVGARRVLDVQKMDARIGEKRKIMEASTDEAQDSLPSKRRAFASSHVGDSSGDSLTSTSTSSARNSNLLIPSTASVSTSTSSRLPRIASDTSLNSRVSLGMRAETEVTTPSLSSDNEHENGSNESNERSPPTPPLESSASMSMQDKGFNSQSRNAEKVLRTTVHDVDKEEDIDMEMHHSEQPRSNLRHVVRSRETTQTADSFARRAPASPRLLDSPRRPRRPAARPRLIKEVPQTEDRDYEDQDEDLLSFSYTSADTPSYSYSRVEERDQEEHGQKNAPESLPLRLPIRPPPGLFKPPMQKKSLPSRLPVRQGSQISQSRSSARATSNNATSAPSTLRRRESLDAELRRAEEEAEAAYEADIFNDHVLLESGTFTGGGTRSRKQGFLAFGGAGGPSVVMGEGSVEGLENLENFDEEEAMPSSRRVRRPMATHV